ncbi:contractile injection system protein, VgrG/Pvc8 family [Thalassobius sp. I31.1]|uniref:phage late control D family protein n=1 Tax=Thalassobius sp. I31.1 TaxID=2109912 RepID=UPI000D19DC54|nr:contractile injection system protein, VgrG/Pvc8 family [Thalassobius sp. I31.1]
MQIDYQILEGGSDITARFKDRLTGLSITDEAGLKSDSAEISVDNRDQRVELPPVGAKLEIALGFKETGLTAMGHYIVDDLSGEIMPEVMTISAKAADMLGSIRAPKTRAWEAVTLGDIVNTIAADHNLKPAVSEDLQPAFFGYLAQTSESDLNLLTRLARDLNATVKPAAGHLVFVRRGAGKTVSGEDILPHVIHRSQISRGSWKLTGRGKYGKVTAEWSETGTASLHRVSAGEKSPELKLRHPYATEAEARRAAEAALRASQFASGSISLQLGGFFGDIAAESPVDLQGILPELTGIWIVTRVTHRLGETLTTSIDAKRGEES